MGTTLPTDLITGSAGIVGTHLAEALARKGRHVRALDLLSPAPSHAWPELVESAFFNSGKVNFQVD